MFKNLSLGEAVLIATVGMIVGALVAWAAGIW